MAKSTNKNRRESKWLSAEDIAEIQPYQTQTYTSTLPCYSALDYKVDLKCKNEKQKEFYNLIKENEIIFCSGSAGSGKSFIALAAALELLKNPDNNYKNILLITQTVQAEMEVGFLKGDLNDKIAIFLEPAWYNIEKILTKSGNKKPAKEILSELRKCDYIKYNHIAFLRGVNIDKSVVIIDEAQQYTKSAMKTILTRIGENSKYIFLSDVEQCDNKELKKNKEMIGVKYAMERLKDVDGVGCCEFTNTDIVRNPIISKILDKWD